MGSWLRSPSSLMAKLSHAPKQPGSQTNPFSLQWPLGSLALIPLKKTFPCLTLASVPAPTNQHRLCQEVPATL